jgi:hypothetical protein
MRTSRMLVAILLVASSTFAQEPAKATKPPELRRLIAHIGPIPDPAVYITEAHVRVTNRPGLGVVIAIDDLKRHEGDGITDRVVIFQGADEVAPFDGIAMVHVRKPADLCTPPQGASLIGPDPWVCPVAPEEVIISGKGIRLAVSMGARSQFVPENAVIPSRTVGIIVYTGPMVSVPLAQIDAVEFLQP